MEDIGSYYLRYYCENTDMSFVLMRDIKKSRWRYHAVTRP